MSLNLCTKVPPAPKDSVPRKPANGKGALRRDQKFFCNVRHFRLITGSDETFCSRAASTAAKSANCDDSIQPLAEMILPNLTRILHARSTAQEIS